MSITAGQAWRTLTRESVRPNEYYRSKSLKDEIAYR